MRQYWTQLLSELKECVDESSIDKWFDHCSISFYGDRALLKVPNKFSLNWINEHYQDLVQEKIAEISGPQYKLEIVIGKAEQMALPGLESGPPPKKKISPRKKTPLNKEYRLALNPKYTFDSFVVGASNRFSHAASLAVADQPAKVYNPLFIYGSVGLGKTHLLNAVGHKIIQDNPDARVRFVSSENFMNELIHCVRFDKMNDFRAKFRDNIDVLLVDDVHFLAGKDRTQEEFFHTFNTLFDSRKQIVISSNQYPKEINDLDERLVSRFVWGLIADIQMPDLETKLAILSKKASDNDLPLSNDLALFLATNLGANVRELEGSLTRIFAYASLNKLEATPELAKEALKNVLDKTQIITVEQIQKVVANFFNIKISDLKSHRKVRVIAHPRQICMYLARKHTDSSFPDIGSKFGNKHHSTVIHAVQKIKDRIEKDGTLKTTIETLEKSICV